MSAAQVRATGVLGLALLGAWAGGFAQTPPAAELPEALSADRSVKDPVFALLIGLVGSDSYGTLTRPRLEKELGRDAARSRLPYRKLLELRRTRGEGARPGEVGVRFDGSLALPIPYSILGYHPGSVVGSESCVFREWVLASVSVRGEAKAGAAGAAGAADLRLEDVHVLGLHSGRLSIDFDWWLDALLGASLDDTEVQALIVFRHQARWLGMALGRNRKGENRSGAFDFGADRIVFPATSEMKAVARQLRRQAEQLGMCPAELGHIPSESKRNDGTP